MKRQYFLARLINCLLIFNTLFVLVHHIYILSHGKTVLVSGFYKFDFYQPDEVSQLLNLFSFYCNSFIWETAQCTFQFLKLYDSSHIPNHCSCFFMMSVCYMIAKLSVIYRNGVQCLKPLAYFYTFV